MEWSHLLALWLHLLLTVVSSNAAKIPAIIVFGDSSVDAGNNNHLPTIARSNFEPYGRDFLNGRATGRFSNGRVVTDFMSEAFGLLPVVPAYLDPAYSMSEFAVGVTFASAATGYDNATADVLGVIPLWKEIEYYKEYQKRLRRAVGDWPAIYKIVNALYVISIGTNDFLENYYNTLSSTGRRFQYTIEEYQEFLIGIARNFIVELHALGARKISLGGVPPMGCMPLERALNVANGNACMENYNVVATNFNTKLSELVVQMNQDLPGLQLVFSNPYYILQNIVDHPSLYGFEVSERGCCASGTFEMGFTCHYGSQLSCRDADKFVFWDAFHPSEKTNRIIAHYLLNTSLHKFF